MQRKLIGKEQHGGDTSNLAGKSDLTRLKVEVDIIDIDKLKAVSPDLSKVSNAVENSVVKINVYDELVTKANAVILVN